MHVVAKDPKVIGEVDNYIEEAQEGKYEALSGEVQEDWGFDIQENLIYFI